MMDEHLRRTLLLTYKAMKEHAERQSYDLFLRGAELDGDRVMMQCFIRPALSLDGKVAMKCGVVLTLDYIKFGIFVPEAQGIYWANALIGKYEKEKIDPVLPDKPKFTDGLKDI